MRARYPDVEGVVSRDGVHLGYEVVGVGQPPVLLMPTWTIVHARFWKMQVAHLARRHRVVTYDGPGNGRSDRVTDPARYSADAYAADALAVLDAVGIETAVVVGLSLGAQYGVRLASIAPDRVAGLVLVGPALPLGPPDPARAGIAQAFHGPPPTEPRGWERYNLAYWHAHYQDFARFFFEQAFHETHSTKPREDAVRWSLETGPDVLEAEAARPRLRLDDTRHATRLDDARAVPRHGDPRHDDPRHDDPRHDDPRHEDPRHDDPRHGDSRHGNPRRDVSRHGDPRRGDARDDDARDDDGRDDAGRDRGGDSGARRGVDDRTGRASRGAAAWTALLEQLTCPVLVVHGSADRIQPHAAGVAAARAANGTLVTFEGSGHLPNVREPVRFNRVLDRFLAGLAPRPQVQPTVVTRALVSRPRLLFLSSPIGLGHARRDLAIATALKQRHPDLVVEWLAQDPVTRVLAEAGETIHPASAWLAGESAHIASEADGHDLHCFQALRRMDEILLANFMVFQEVVEEGAYDVVVGDEAWDVDHYWHENPELKRGAHVWMTDFVGYLPMPSGGEHEAHLTADYNAEMIEHVGRYPRIRDRAIFVGSPEDVVDDAFGPDLPDIRAWTEEHFDFAGYVTGFTPPSPEARTALRHDLGYGPDEAICIVSVGGSGVGRHLIRLAVDALPLARRAVPELRMVVVAGPFIDPDAVPDRDGLEVRGYVERLHRHLSVCDLAVVQGGLTTTMELTAARRPFIYFPLGDHFEQRIHVRHRLDRYRAGRCMDSATTDPDRLADAMVAELDRPVAYRDVENDGARRAAALIGELL